MVQGIYSIPGIKCNLRVRININYPILPREPYLTTAHGTIFPYNPPPPPRLAFRRQTFGVGILVLIFVCVDVLCYSWRFIKITSIGPKFSTPKNLQEDFQSNLKKYQYVEASDLPYIISRHIDKGSIRHFIISVRQTALMVTINCLLKSEYQWPIFDFLAYLMVKLNRWPLGIVDYSLRIYMW